MYLDLPNPTGAVARIFLFEEIQFLTQKRQVAKLRK
jgi:hypothetical protein